MAFSLQDLFPHLMTDPAGEGPEMAPQSAPERQGPSKGQMILGILGDALAGAAGRGPAYGQMIAGQRQRADEQAQEEANWGRRLQNYEAQKQIDQRYATPDVSPMERDAAAWQRMGPEQRAAYGQFKSISSPEPDVVTTLPNGQLYAGPRSGLAAALGGGAQPQRPAIGTVVRDPRMNGGQTPPASGGFRIP